MGIRLTVLEQLNLAVNDCAGLLISPAAPPPAAQRQYNPADNRLPYLGVLFPAMELVFKGMAGHAGTVPMNMRQDALCCAAEAVLAIERFGQEHQQTLVATVGKLDIRHAASNVIPGEVVCSLDLRSADEEHLNRASQALREKVQAIVQQRNITLDWTLIQQTAPVTCDAALNSLLARAIADSGYKVVSLVSSAGHDAVPISKVAPATMLFVRCFKGISHNPLENVELPDLAAALRVAERFLTQLIAHHS